MRDLSLRLADLIVEELEQEIALVHGEVLTGRIDGMERYKLLMGKLEGLGAAKRSVAAALKKMRTFDDDE